jgi:SPP1 gp7 family putative phage head morphogenesis protein
MRYTFSELIAAAQAIDAVDRMRAELAEFAAQHLDDADPAAEGVIDFLDVSAGDAFDVAAEKAIEYFKAKGLRPTFSYADMLGRAHDEAFTVAKMMDLDLLKQVRDSLDAALANGQTFGEWKKELAPILKAAGWWGEADMIDPATGNLVRARLGSAWRLETIFRTNLQTAYAAGVWRQIESQADVAPFLLYDAVDDYRTRPAHAAWDSTVLTVSSPWWHTHYPPNGWNCRCSVIQLDREQLRDMGLTPRTEPPTDGTVQWTNPRTGNVERVPVGIDPGFDRNAGDTSAGAIRELLLEKVKTIQPDALDAVALSIKRALPGANVPQDIADGTARLRIAQTAYSRVFGIRAPDPLGVNPLSVAVVLEQAIVESQPVPADFDWWAELPPDAVA